METSGCTAAQSRIRRPVQGTRVPSLVREEHTCGATRSMCRNYPGSLPGPGAAFLRGPQARKAAVPCVPREDKDQSSLCPSKA